jgi:putative redox protein
MTEQRTTSSLVTARWQRGYRADVTVRDFSLVVDEPESAGGADAGPMPTEFLLVSLSSCFALALSHVARKRSIELGPFTVTAQGTYEGAAFSAIDVSVAVDGPVPTEIDTLLERAERVCYVSNTFARRPAIRFSVAARR